MIRRCRHGSTTRPCPGWRWFRRFESGLGDARIAAVVYFQAFGRLGALDAHVPRHCAAIVAGQVDEAGCLDRAGLMTFTRMPRPRTSIDRMSLKGRLDEIGR